MNAPMRTPVPASAEDKVLAGSVRFGIIVSIGTLIIAVFVMLAEQAGLPGNYAALLAGVVMVLGITVPALQTRTMSPADWLVARRGAARTVNAMALAASLITGWTLSTLAGLFFAGSLSSVAWIAGPLLGLAIASFLIVPFLRKSGAVTLAEMIALRFANRPAGLAVAVAAIVAGVLLLWSQFRVAGALGDILFPFDRRTATAGAAVMTGLAVLPGGLRAVIRINAVIFAFLATAYLLPIVWLSATFTGFPIPQLAYGHGALIEISDIEQQLSALGFARLAGQVDGVAFASHPAISAVALCVFLAVGLCAMPFVLGHFPAARRGSSTRGVAGWTILFIALVLTAAPALAAFAKLWLYHNMLGLTVDETAKGADWLLAWGGHEAISEPLAMARLCGHAVTDGAGAINACGGNTDYVIGPADVRFAAETVTLAFARIVGMPRVFGGLIAAAALAAALASANAVAFSIGATGSRDLVVGRTGRGSPASTGLFRGRLVLIAAIIAAAWLATGFDQRPLDVAMWGLAIGASVIAPVMIATIWWDRMNWQGVVAGVTAGSLTLAAQAWAVHSAHVQGKTGAGMVTIPGFADLPAALHAATLALPVAMAAIAAASLYFKTAGDGEVPEALEAIRRPDTEPLTRGPEV